MLRTNLLNPGSKTVLRTFETNAFKISKASDTLGADSMASSSFGAGTIATIHSEVGITSKVVTSLLALLPQP